MVLLDTPSLLWWINRDNKLSPRALGAIEAERPGGEIIVSTLSAYQIARWVHEGRLELSMSPADWFARLQAAPEITLAPIDAPLALQAAPLPLAHAAARLLIAQARRLNCPLITQNPALAGAGLAKIIW
ncbi:type II toxin-antitoxin system VapC family toxin [Acidocella sp.]|uniref:type II toxin-antitoxin system VapC family toxin n=1 Tax=Acidocella sp. TaxID=50710 RepID=UPI0026153048|nr:type II toxin-antitoxin system VapC family toxin [Acidocella sp.]